MKVYVTVVDFFFQKKLMVSTRSVKRRQDFRMSVRFCDPANVVKATQQRAGPSLMTID